MLALLLMLEDGAELDQIASYLRVSRAGVSTNTRLLERIGAIRRHSVAGNRRVVYRAAEDRHAQLTQAALGRMRGLVEIIRRTAAALPADMSRVTSRLAGLETYYLASIEIAETVLARLLSGTPVAAAGPAPVRKARRRRSPSR